MSYNGISPIATLVKKEYFTGVKLTPLEMQQIEKKIVRLIGLENWYVKLKRGNFTYAG